MLHVRGIITVKSSRIYSVRKTIRDEYCLEYMPGCNFIPKTQTMEQAAVKKQIRRRIVDRWYYAIESESLF